MAQKIPNFFVQQHQKRYGSIIAVDSVSFIYTNSFDKYMETITNSRSEYERLKKIETLDFELIGQFASSLDDLKKGRFKRLA